MGAGGTGTGRRIGPRLGPRIGWRPIVMVAVVLVVALPALRQPPRDGFPLSTYPMFASERGREVVVHTAVAIGADDEVDRLDPEVIADTDEVMLAAETVRLAIQNGGSARLCTEIAGRLEGDDDDRVAVELRRETYDAVRYFDGDRDPSAYEVDARCEVDGS